MKRTKLPQGWDEARVARVAKHYDEQPEDEAVAEDEAALRERHADPHEGPGQAGAGGAEAHRERAGQAQRCVQRVRASDQVKL